MCVYVCVFIEGVVLNQSEPDQLETLVKILSIAKETQFPTFFIKLEQVLCTAMNIFSAPGDIKRYL